MNIGDKNAKFENGTKVKVYFGQKYITKGTVIEDCNDDKTVPYQYVVRSAEGDGTYFADELLEDKE